MGTWERIHSGKTALLMVWVTGRLTVQFPEMGRSVREADLGGEKGNPRILICQVTQECWIRH